MGMTRAVGFGFLLLLVVTHASGEANRRQTILNSLSSNQYHLIDAETEKIIYGAKVGDKFYFLMDRNRKAAKWSAERRSESAKFLRIGAVNEAFRSANDGVPSLDRVEVVPKKTGDHAFEIKLTDTIVKTVRFLSVSQGPAFFVVLENASRNPTEKFRSPLNTNSTVYAEYWSQDYNWEIAYSFDVRTTPIIDATEFEDNYYCLGLKKFNVTTTNGGYFPTVELKLKKKSDHSVSNGHIINIEA